MWFSHAASRFVVSPAPAQRCKSAQPDRWIARTTVLRRTSTHQPLSNATLVAVGTRLALAHRPNCNRPNPSAVHSGRGEWANSKTIWHYQPAILGQATQFAKVSKSLPARKRAHALADRSYKMSRSCSRFSIPFIALRSRARQVSRIYRDTTNATARLTPTTHTSNSTNSAHRYRQTPQN